MKKVVNLNQVRKQKARDQKRATADANSVKFGRNKSQKELEKSRSRKSADTLDQHKLEE